MNSKLLFVAILGSAALGYYLYAPELPLFASRAELAQLQSEPAGKKRAKVCKAQTQELPAAQPETPPPAPDATPSPVAEAPAPEPEVVSAPAPEPEKAATPAKPQLAQAGSARVADVLAGLPLVKEATPNAKARYYFYLMSAGWCGPCNMEMPNVVKAYEEIRKSGIAEIILVDFDDSPENARAYMEKYGATFPAIMKDLAPALPGIQPPGGIPSAILVDEMGNPVVSGHGSIISQWKEHISAHEKKSGLPASFSTEPEPAAAEDEVEDDAPVDEDAADQADDDSEKKATAKKKTRNLVARALPKVKWASGRPNKKAEYYIYLQSASWCGPCRAEMPHIAEEYKAMKKDGRVELLLISFDRSEGAAKNFMSNHKATFPMVLKTGKGVNKLPGFTMARGVPSATIVNAEGKVLASGHGSLVREWRRYTIEQAAEGEQE